jgi:RIO kinase 2
VFHKIFGKLSKEDFIVLNVVARYLDSYEYVPLRILSDHIDLSRKTLNESLKRLVSSHLLTTDPQNLLGYKMTFTGLNVLSLKRLADRGIVKMLGPMIGVGKESVVYLAKDHMNRSLAIKFYRIGFKSFKNFSKKRSYDVKSGGNIWLLRSIFSAEREYEIFNKLNNINASVPRVFGRELNAIVMEYIEGVLLYKLKVAKDPYKILRDILETVRKAYVELGVVHSDLSQYNVLVNISEESERAYVFDWPQWVYFYEPSAENLLIRDLNILIRFFRNRFGIKDISVDKVYKYVTGEAEDFV